MVTSGRCSKGSLDVRSQSDRALSSGTDERTAALPGDHQLFVAQKANRVLDSHARHVVPLGQVAT
jgi:hypothetical protein